MFVPLVDVVLSLALALVVVVVVVALSLLVLVVISLSFSLLTLSLGTTCCVVSFFSTIATYDVFGTVTRYVFSGAAVEATFAFALALAFTLAIEGIKVIVEVLVSSVLESGRWPIVVRLRLFLGSGPLVMLLVMPVVRRCFVVRLGIAYVHWRSISCCASVRAELQYSFFESVVAHVFDAGAGVVDGFLR